jgi:general secretion pathway protein C
MRIRLADHCVSLSFVAVRQQRKMQLLSFDRSNSAQTAAITLVTAAALILLALVAAYWTWEWLAPRAEPRAQPAANAGGHAASANGLFGNQEQDRNSASPTGAAIRLHGIVAATAGRRGYAVMQLEPREIVTVREGEDIAPGIRLAEVDTDQVILERGGIRETLAWPKKNTLAESAAPRANK